MKIAALRRKQNITQRALAQELGYSQAVIAQVEAGHRKPWPKLKKKVAEYFGVDWREVEA